MGKQKKRNAFFYFMLEKKPEVEKRLNRKVTMAEMSQHVTAEWQELPDSKKNKFRSMSGQNREKLDCRGVPLRQLEQEAQEKREQAEEMKRDIADMVDMYHLGGALHQPTFYIVSTNYYVLTDLDHYIPAELSILQFSFKSGIIREFHGAVKPFLPFSYAARSRKHCSDTHNLVVDPDKSSGLSMDDMADRLMQFLSKDKDWNEDVPFYTLHQEMEQTRQIFHTITEKEYKVYSLDMLYQFIYSATIRTIPKSIANDLITDVGLDFYPNLSCKWHIANQIDAARFCTLSTVRRWLYFMCEFIDVKKTFGVVPEEGKHYPYQQLEEGLQRSISSLTLEDTDSVEGATGYDPWTLVGARNKHSAKPHNADFFPVNAQLTKKGKKENAAVAHGDVLARSIEEVE